MDLTTMLRNVKSGRYKNKADFVTDLDLIWENCMHYNTQEVCHFYSSPSNTDTQTHPLRAAARLMKQKADHHLTFLADKDDRSATNVLQHLPAKYTSASARSQRQASESASVSAQAQAQAPTSYSLHSRKADIIEEDAAGESDGEVDAGTGTGTDFRDGAKRADQARLGSGENQQPGCGSCLEPMCILWSVY
jgi:transcriptional activator SPT7